MEDAVKMDAGRHVSDEFPTPAVGYWVSECCELDLYQIKTEDELCELLERIERYREDGVTMMVFRTREEADAYLAE